MESVMSKNKTKQQIHTLATQSEKSDKKSGAVKLLVISALILSSIAIFLLTKENREVVKREPQLATQHISTPAPRAQQLVPSPIEINHDFRSVESLPQIVPDQLRTSADVILKLEASPFLQTQDDHEIFALLKEYVEGKRAIHWTLDPNPLISKGASASAAMAFNCVDPNPGDSFGVGPVQWNTEMVALVFYHELKHAVDCHVYEQKHGVRREPDDVSLEESEKVAYAAQVRFFVALYHAGMLPKVVSGSPYGDFGIFQNMQEVWQAILNNRFGEWYRQAGARNKPMVLNPSVYQRADN